MAQPCYKSNKTRQQTTMKTIHEMAIVFDYYLNILKIAAGTSESQGHPQAHREFKITLCYRKRCI